MPRPPTSIVWMDLGDLYGPVYVVRLARMIARHMGEPYTLACVVDHDRPLPEGVARIDAREWDLPARYSQHPALPKLRLFGEAFAASLDRPEFLYLDLTLVIRSGLRPLLDFADSRPEELVIVRDWHYPCFNSSVVRVRSGALAEVTHAFEVGRTCPKGLGTDQDFLYHSLCEDGEFNRVALLPEGMVTSYKNLRLVNRTDPEAARRKLDLATIVKFHGEPKMHQVLDPWYRLNRIALRRLRGLSGFKDAGFWVRELRREWH